MEQIEIEDVDAEGAAEEPEASAEDKSKELLAKLGQLRQLIQAKGDKVSPDELASLKKLEKMLSETFGTGAGLGESAGSSKEVTEYFTACVALALGRVSGSKRVDALASLKRLSEDKFTPAQASESEFFRMTISCLNRLTDDEYDLFKAGSLKQLPIAHVDASKKPEMTDEVVNADPSFWGELKIVAQGLGALGEPEAPGSSIPTWVLPILGLPVFGGMVFVIKRLMDQLDEKESRKEEKAAKKAKKKD